MFKKVDLSVIIMLVLLGLVGYMTVYPLGMIAYGSFRSAGPADPGYFTLDGYRQGYSDPTIPKALWTTIWIAVVRNLTTLVLGIFLTWLVIRTDMPFKGPLEALFWLNYFIPNMPMTMGWIQLLDPGYGFINQLWGHLPFTNAPLMNIYSYWGIIWVHVANGTSAVVLYFGPAFLNLDASLEESARMSGSGYLTTLRRIVFPILLPALLGVTFLRIVHSLESFETELLLGMPAKIYVYSTKVFDLVRWEPPRYTPAMALSVVFMVVVAILVILQRYMVGRRQYTTVSGRGFMSRPVALGKWRWAAFGISALFIVITCFLPLAFLILGTFMKISGLFDVPEPFTLEHWQTAFTDPLFFPSLKNSLILATGTAVVGALFMTVLSYIIVRTKLRGRVALDFMTWLPWAAPGLLIALGILWVFLGGIVSLKFMYGTLFIIGFAMIITRLPMGMRLLNGSMHQLGMELEEASRVHGATWSHTFRTIVMPLMWPSVLTVVFISFLHALTHIQTVVLLYGPESRTLSILMLEHYIGFSHEKGLVIGLLLCLFAFVVAAAARAFRVRLK